MIENIKYSKGHDKCGKEWFRDWFSSPYYSLLYNNRNAKEAEEFLARLMKEPDLTPPKTVLDLACGKGRHSIYLNSIGFDVTGIDLSNESIVHAKRFENPGLKFDVGDMRSFQLSKTFDCILNLFTSFGYFNNVDDNLLVLSCVKRHLKKEGIFVLDYLNPELVEQAGEQHYTEVKDNVHFEILKSLNNDFVIKKIRINDSGCCTEFEERVQLLRYKQLETMFQIAGLTPFRIFGNYQLDTFIPSSSERMIIIARN